MLMRPLAALIVMFALIAIPAAAQDIDGDGLSDALEKQLLTDPAFPETLEVIAEDAAGDVKQEGRRALRHHPRALRQRRPRALGLGDRVLSAPHLRQHLADPLRGRRQRSADRSPSKINFKIYCTKSY